MAPSRLTGTPGDRLIEKMPLTLVAPRCQRRQVVKDSRAYNELPDTWLAASDNLCEIGTTPLAVRNMYVQRRCSHLAIPMCWRFPLLWEWPEISFVAKRIYCSAPPALLQRNAHVDPPH